MTFKNTKTKILYYFFMVNNIIISILIFTSFFSLQELTLYNSFLILFFGCFFMQIGVEFLIVLLYYSFTESKKNKIIHRIHIIYVGWVVSFISMLPLELGISDLIIFGYSPMPLFLAFIGGFVLLFFFYLKQNPDIHFIKPERPTEKDLLILKELDVFHEISKIEEIASNYHDQGNHEEALRLLKKALKMLLEGGYDRYTLRIKNKIRKIEFILNE